MNNLITINAITKESIKSEVDKIVEAVENGEIDPLKIMFQIKAYEKLFSDLAPRIKDAAMIEADKYDIKEYEGIKFSIAATGGSLDYDNDMECQILNNKLKARKDVLKAAQKAAENGAVYIDKATGEEIPPVGYKTPKSSTLRVEFK